MNRFISTLSHSLLLSGLFISSQVLANETISQSLSADEVSSISIENQSGTVKVIGWNKDKVAISGQLDDKAEELIFEQRGAQIVIKVEYPNMERWTSSGTDLIVKAPKNLRLDLASISSDFSLSNLHGGVEAKTVSGDIDGDELTEQVELSTISGNVTTKDLTGKISLSSVSGDIDDKNSNGRLQLQSVSGEVEVNTKAAEVFVNNVSGSTDLRLDEVLELRISTVSGDVEAKLHLKDKGLLKASSVSGDVELEFQQGVDANFRLKSNVGGDLVNKLTDDEAKHPKYGPGAKLNFQTGQGNASVSANSVSGNIVVKSQ